MLWHGLSQRQNRTTVIYNTPYFTSKNKKISTWWRSMIPYTLTKKNLSGLTQILSYVTSVQSQAISLTIVDEIAEHPMIDRCKTYTNATNQLNSVIIKLHHPNLNLNKDQIKTKDKQPNNQKERKDINSPTNLIPRWPKFLTQTLRPTFIDLIKK